MARSKVKSRARVSSTKKAAKKTPKLIKPKFVIVCGSSLRIPKSWKKKIYLGKGRNLNVYVLPSIDEKFEKIPVDRIKYYIAQLIYTANRNKNTTYYVTPRLRDYLIKMHTDTHWIDNLPSNITFKT